MGYKTHQPGWRRVFALAAGQHGVVTRTQLLELGVSSQGIKHRLARGKLHPVHRGIYAVGRPELTADGRPTCLWQWSGAEPFERRCVMGHRTA